MAYFYLTLLIPAWLIEFYAGGLKYGLHPLNITGGFAVFLEKKFRAVSGGFISGLLFNLSLVFTAAAVFVIIDAVLLLASPAAQYFFSVYMLVSFLSTGGLRSESTKIRRFLKKNDIESARENLLALAGRDRENLDSSEISRAVVESVAENTGDGNGSVMFYYAAGTLIGLAFCLITGAGACFYAAAVSGTAAAVIYKSINLLDSLVGYRNEKYEKFGKFSARLDDAANYIPFRITAAAMIASVFMLDLLSKVKPCGDRRYHTGGAFKAWAGYRGSHPSPNGGHLESVTAGALNIKLGGTNYYGGVESKRPVIGFENYGAAKSENIADAVKLMELTSFLLIVFYTALLLLSASALRYFGYFNV